MSDENYDPPPSDNPSMAPDPYREPSLMEKVQASFQTHSWWWIGGGGGVVVAAVLAVLVFGGFFGPSGRAICQATLDQAREFGVVPYSAKLASSSAKSTDVDGRKSCTASADDQTYTMLVDVKKEDAEHAKCKDFKKQNGCVALFSVANAQGMMTYQYRQPPDDDQDAAMVPQGAAPGAAGAGAADPNAAATDTATDNSDALTPSTGDSDLQTAPADSSQQPQQ